MEQKTETEKEEAGQSHPSRCSDGRVDLRSSLHHYFHPSDFIHFRPDGQNILKTGDIAVVITASSLPFVDSNLPSVDNISVSLHSSFQECHRQFLLILIAPLIPNPE
jgi:hypothetical protein